MTDLTKAGLAIPPQVAHLEDIKKLNRLALEKAHIHSVNSNPVPNGITATIANGTKVENSVPNAPTLEVKLLCRLNNVVLTIIIHFESLLLHYNPHYTHYN